MSFRSVLIADMRELREDMWPKLADKQLCHVVQNLVKTEIRQHKNNFPSHSYTVEVLAHTMQNAQQKALSKSEAAITAALKNVYFAAKHDLAYVMIPELYNLCLKRGVTLFNDLRMDAHTTYGHHNSIGDFQKALAGVLHEDMLQKLQKHP